MSTSAVNQLRELHINSHLKRKRKQVWTTHACRPGRCINSDQQTKRLYDAAVPPARCSCISTAIKLKSKERLADTAGSIRAVYQPRELYINSNHKSETEALLVDTSVTLLGVYQPRSAKQSFCGAAVYHHRGISVYQEQLRTKAQSLVDDTVVSTSEVYQPQELYR